VTALLTKTCVWTRPFKLLMRQRGTLQTGEYMRVLKHVSQDRADFQTRGLRAACGPRWHFVWPAML